MIDNALTRPYSKKQRAERNPDPHPNWGQTFCTENNNHIVIGTEHYLRSADGGLLMPAKKDQAPPDLRYFKQTQK